MSEGRGVFEATCLDCGGEGKVLFIGPGDNMDEEVDDCEHCGGSGLCTDPECECQDEEG